MKTSGPIRRLRPWAVLAACLWAFSACDLSEVPETRHFIQLRLPDSVRVGDSVEALLRLPGDSARVDTLWNGPLPSDSTFAKLPAPHYDGGDADLFVSAWDRDQGRLFYNTRVEYRKDQGKPRITDLLPPDTLAPRLVWEGPDSLDLDLMPDDSVLARMFPDMLCLDDRDRQPVRPAVEYVGDSTRVGLGRIRYGCRDRAGNAAAARFRRLRILSEVDTVPPSIIFSQHDSITVWLGQTAMLGTVYCADAKDPRPRIQGSGWVDESALGTYPLVYECEDASGNVARRRRVVYVIREPDTVKPVLTRAGPDTARLWEGDSFQDTSKVRCVDERDGELPAAMAGITTGSALPRGWYPVEYRCMDLSGNEAVLPLVIQVLRSPDPTPPRLTLRGPDSLEVYDREAYADSGADCIDDRDGRLPVEVRNPVDTRVRKGYAVLYACADSAGNAAATERKVRVVRRPDGEKPVIILRGPDTAIAYVHEGFTDSGAVCVDVLDGRLAVETQGAIDTERRGLQILVFTCADSAGNAVRMERVVRVLLRPDTVKPVLTLRGRDSVQALQGQAYADSGADCTDDRDGSLPVRTTGILNTGLRGPQTLSLRCADSAGNEALRIRHVLVIRVPDTAKPVLTLSGPDSLQVWQGSVYSDPGATCVDDRDGSLPLQLGGSVNTAVRGSYTLTYRCADSVGNSSDRVRQVSVARFPDTERPVLTLRGPANVKVLQGTAYADSGAECLDDRDGTLPVLTRGGVNSAVPGTYEIGYACSDSAGNAADSLIRSVKVHGTDTVPPVIALAGTDTLLLVSAAPFFDPGGSCRDAEDGVLPLILQGITKPVTRPGWYQAGYACTDKAGNTAVRTRVLKIGLFGVYIPDIADAQIDISNPWANVGASSSLGITNDAGQYISIIRYDMSKVAKEGLKTAKLHLFTFLHNKAWRGGFINLTFRIYRVKRLWGEGTGDWFYHDGGYKNGGETWYQYYPLSDSLKAAVSNPEVGSGINGQEFSLVHDSALVPVATRTDSIFYGPWDPFKIPAPENLSPVELDVTEYIKTVIPSQDFGFVIKVSGLPAGMHLAFTTREAACGPWIPSRDVASGPWAPRLMLEYMDQ